LREQLESAAQEKESLSTEHAQLQHQAAELKKSAHEQQATIGALQVEKETLPQGPEGTKGEKAILEWYRVTFKERNKEAKEVKLQNKHLELQVQSLQKEVAVLKKAAAKKT